MKWSNTEGDAAFHPCFHIEILFISTITASKFRLYHSSPDSISFWGRENEIIRQEILSSAMIRVDEMTANSLASPIYVRNFPKAEGLMSTTIMTTSGEKNFKILLIAYSTRSMLTQVQA